MYLTEDRSAPKQHHKTLQDSSQTNIAMTTETLHFTDIWRLFHRIDKEYTFYSCPHNVFTRVDYIFGTDNTIPTISRAEIHDIAISHTPISISLADPNPQPTPCLWCFPSFLYKNADFRPPWELLGKNSSLQIPSTWITPICFGVTEGFLSGVFG